MFSLDEGSMQGAACMDGIGCIAFVVELCEHCVFLLWYFVDVFLRKQHKSMFQVEASPFTSQ